MPHGVRNGTPREHGGQVAVRRSRVRGPVLDSKYSWKPVRLLLDWIEMNNAMQCSAWHDVDEERRYFVETMENQRVAPHDDSNRIVTKGKTVNGCK